MEIKFSDELTQVIAWSRDEAQRTGWHNISIDHLILAALRKTGGNGRLLLESLGLNPDELKERLDFFLMKDSPVPFDSISEIRLSGKALGCLNLALFEATRAGMDAVDTSALLLSVAKTPGSITGEFLASKGIDTSALSAAMKGKGDGRAEEDYSQFTDRMSSILASELGRVMSMMNGAGGIHS